ncbi:MAG: cytochrome c oxidase subunit 3, partial [Methylocystis sp.]|nr:cytochrome c oxidase subunit 3 [Methylocystis sp.]
MADGHAKPEHDYHLVDPSPWPIVGALAALITAIGAVMWMAQHKGAPIGGMTFGGTMFFVGLGGILLVMYAWWSDIIHEASVGGFHSPVVRLHHRYGMILFIFSEVMFFVAWF